MAKMKDHDKLQAAMVRLISAQNQIADACDTLRSLEQGTIAESLTEAQNLVSDEYQILTVIARAWKASGR